MVKSKFRPRTFQLLNHANLPEFYQQSLSPKTLGT